MTNAQKTVMTLIKSSLLGEKMAIPTDTDWEKVLKISNRHQIIPLIYYGIVNSGLEFNLKSQFFNFTVQATMIEENQLFELEKLKRDFINSNIDFLVLKGPVIKSKYPHSEMRTMSDIDILIKPDQYEKIVSVMENNGYSFALESDHEFVWRKKPFVSIELHKHLIPSYNRDFYSYFGDGWQLAKPLEKGNAEHIFSQEDVFLYAFTHFTKHYRDGGIGLRHLTDIYVLFNNDMDTEYIEKALKKLELFDFYNNIIKTLKVCFEDEKPDEVTERIMNWVFESGPYGLKKKYELATATKEAINNGNVSAEKQTFKNVFFPSVSFAKKRYPILNKAPFLLPAIWVIRAFSALFFRRENIKENTSKLKNVTDKAVEEYNNELEKVGLKFN